MTVRVTVNQGALDRLLRRRGGAAERRLQAKVDEVADIAARNGPFKRSDFQTEVGPGARGLTGTVRNTSKWGLFYEKGTKRHDIVAPGRPGAQALRFRPSGQGGYVFRKRVRHPGQPARWLLRNALRQAGRR